jgi:hypothetical protein
MKTLSLAGESLVLGFNPSPFLVESVAALVFSFIAAVNIDNG